LSISGGKFGPAKETGYAAIEAEAEKRVVVNNATRAALATKKRLTIYNFGNLAFISTESEYAPIPLRIRICNTLLKGGI